MLNEWTGHWDRTKEWCPFVLEKENPSLAYLWHARFRSTLSIRHTHAQCQYRFFNATCQPRRIAMNILFLTGTYYMRNADMRRPEGKSLSQMTQKILWMQSNYLTLWHRAARAPFLLSSFTLRRWRITQGHRPRPWLSKLATNWKKSNPFYRVRCTIGACSLSIRSIAKALFFSLTTIYVQAFGQRAKKNKLLYAAIHPMPGRARNTAVATFGCSSYALIPIVFRFLCLPCASACNRVAGCWVDRQNAPWIIYYPARLWWALYVIVHRDSLQFFFYYHFSVCVFFHRLKSAEHIHCHASDISNAIACCA